MIHITAQSITHLTFFNNNTIISNMKGRTQLQRGEKTVKLPQINRTSQSFRAEDSNKVRPQSSKKIDIDDMEKKLFSKIDSIDFTDKFRPKKRKTTVESCQQIKTPAQTTIDDGLQKLSKLMPNLYSKLVETRKYEPLKQSFKYESNVDKGQEAFSFVTDVKGQNIGQKLKNRQILGRQTPSFLPAPQKRQQPSQQSDLCDLQIQKIYKQYLTEEGLSEDTTSLELQHMNNQLLQNQKEVASLMKSYQVMIKKLKTECAPLDEEGLGE